MKKAINRFLQLEANEEVHLIVYNLRGDILFELHRIEDKSNSILPLFFDSDNEIALEFFLETSFIEKENALSRLNFFDYSDKFRAIPELNTKSVFCFIPKKINANTILDLTIEVTTHVHGKIDLVNYELLAY